MKTAFLLAAAVVCGAADAPKDHLKDIRIHQLEQEVAARDFALAKRALDDAQAAHAAATAAMNTAKLEACTAAGGKVADDCTFTADAVTLKKKEEVKK